MHPFRGNRTSILVERSGATRLLLRTRLTFIACLLILLAAGVSDGLCQTKWFRYEGNPVLAPGPPGSWDSRMLLPNRVLLVNAVYRMWYTADAGTGVPHIGYATSPDGITWHKYKGNPVLKPGPQPWDSTIVANVYIIQSDAEYRMWYTGGTQLHEYQIGYATSPDGVRWTKASGQINPVLLKGSAGSWTGPAVSDPSIIGPDSAGGYTMWFTGGEELSARTGYARGRGAMSWTPLPEPVLDAGQPGSWDDLSICFPRVVFHDNLYEMWYTGFRAMTDRRVGYATSTDGIHWERSSENPVFVPGPRGSWDGGIPMHPEILFDGKFYHMWYAGNNHSSDETGTWNVGYAISPAGTAVSVSPVAAAPGSPVQIGVRMKIPLPVSLTAEILSEQDTVAAKIPLLDDGRHGDDSTGDGCFANRWVPAGEGSYHVDLLLEHQKRSYRLRDAAAFTSVGPIVSVGATLLYDETAHPGDTLALSLMLLNQGRLVTARDVEASVAATDTFVTVLTLVSLPYGNIPAGSTARTLGHYRLVVHPDCPPGREEALSLSVSSAGTTFWKGTAVLPILTPWWRTTWALALYLLLLTTSALSAVRVVSVRKLKRKIAQLEQDHALERERMRISQDMHDEVGARLTEIGILGELAKKDLRDPQKSEAEIEKITETSREVIASISEIIWAINTKNDELENLVAYLREYASKALEPAGVACKFDIPDEVPTLQLSTEARRNIFLVIKEALHNIVKHSGATAVQIRMSFSRHTFEIAIEDNGCGFDHAQLGRFGNGLRNMEQRMRDIGGTFEICSSPGQGTKAAVRARLGARG